MVKKLKVIAIYHLNLAKPKQVFHLLEAFALLYYGLLLHPTFFQTINQFDSNVSDSAKKIEHVLYVAQALGQQKEVGLVISDNTKIPIYIRIKLRN